MQAFAEIGVGASDVLAQGVASGGFVGREIVARGGEGLRGCGRAILGSGRARAGCQCAEKEYERDSGMTRVAWLSNSA